MLKRKIYFFKENCLSETYTIYVCHSVCLSTFHFQNITPLSFSLIFSPVFEKAFRVRRNEINPIFFSSKLHYMVIWYTCQRHIQNITCITITVTIFSFLKLQLINTNFCFLKSILKILLIFIISKQK